MTDYDYGATLAAKSNQLNADDLSGGSITVQITGGSVKGNDEQPVQLKLSGGHMPWMPCKGMRRLLAEVAGSTSLEPWIGKWIVLFRDPAVKWGGKPVGGIRLAGVDASMLPQAKDYRVRVSRAGATTYRIKPITSRQNDGAPTANLEYLLVDNELTSEDVDRWRVSKGKAPLSELDDTQRAQVAAWLGADQTRIAAIRAMVPKE